MAAPGHHRRDNSLGLDYSRGHSLRGIGWTAATGRALHYPGLTGGLCRFWNEQADDGGRDIGLCCSSGIDHSKYEPHRCQCLLLTGCGLDPDHWNSVSGRGIFRLGFITQFLSRPVMEGFIFGLAIFVSVSQMPKLFGLLKGEGNTVQQFLHIITHIGQSNWATFAVGIGALILLFGMDRTTRRIPGGLVALILGILVSALLNLSSYGVAVVGSIPAELPSPGLPHIGPINTWILLPGAIGIVLVVFCESLGAANAFADKHGYEIKPDQDLFAFSAANLGSGLLGGLIAGGSMSQTAVNGGAGARSEVSTIIAAALGLVTVVALTSLFYILPEAVLTALIIHAVSHIMKVAEMQRFYNLQRIEFYLGMTALLGVILI